MRQGSLQLAPRDFQGRAIGEQQSNVAIATLNALGARAVPLSASGEGGTVDGIESATLALQSGSYDAGFAQGMPGL